MSTPSSSGRIEIVPPRIKLTVEEKKVEQDRSRKIHPNLPAIPFFIGIIGPRHRGKTVVLHNLLSKSMYGGYFHKDNIVLYSPTYRSDKTLHDLELKWVHTRSNVKHLIEHLKSEQDMFHQAANRADVLLVLEDITNIREVWQPLADLGYTGRHYGIQVLYVAHKMSSIDRGVRTQTQQWILFEPHEQSEFQWLLDMFSRVATRDVWSLALRRAWDIPYGFVVVDYERKEFNEIYKSGFNDPLFTDREAAIIQGFGEDVISGHEIQSESYSQTPENTQQ
jgi:hypothetical protein